MAKPTKLVIDRERWLRGEGPGRSCLLRSDGKMCCLGFLGQACGIDDLGGYFTPSHKGGDLWPDGLLDKDSWDGNSEWAAQAMTLNDDPHVDGGIREASLTRQFAEIGIELEFVDHAPTT